MAQRDMRALAEHHIVVQIVAQVFPQAQRMLVEFPVAGKEIVRPDDGGVAPRIAATDPPLFENGDILQPMFPGEVIGRRQPVQPAADDDDVVMPPRFGITPLSRPAALAVKPVPEDVPRREAGFLVADVLH